jgi:hypothetical protein
MCDICKRIILENRTLARNETGPYRRLETVDLCELCASAWLAWIHEPPTLQPLEPTTRP